MKDHNCKDHLREHSATAVRPYHYIDSGLPNVYLANIKYWTCSECDRQAAEIPSVKKLLLALAESLVNKEGLLTGNEIRFLRKEVGKKAADFAVLINKTPEHFSKLENEQLPLTEDTDKLVRLTYTMLSGNAKLFRSLTENAEEWLTSIQGTRDEKILATRNNKQRAWTVSRKAA
jgi:putative zinc finger/helix-turn-helix YgiT family protein